MVCARDFFSLVGEGFKFNRKMRHGIASDFVPERGIRTFSVAASGLFTIDPLHPPKKRKIAFIYS